MNSRRPIHAIAGDGKPINSRLRMVLRFHALLDPLQLFRPSRERVRRALRGLSVGLIGAMLAEAINPRLCLLVNRSARVPLFGGIVKLVGRLGGGIASVGILRTRCPLGRIAHGGHRLVGFSP